MSITFGLAVVPWFGFGYLSYLGIVAIIFGIAMHRLIKILYINHKYVIYDIHITEVDDSYLDQYEGNSSKNRAEFNKS